MTLRKFNLECGQVESKVHGYKSDLTTSQYDGGKTSGSGADGKGFDGRSLVSIVMDSIVLIDSFDGQI